MTPEEAKELHAEMMKTFERVVGAQRLFTERRDPKLRPPGSVPVEFVLLGYPVLDAPPLPDAGQTDDDPERPARRAEPPPPATHGKCQTLSA